MARGPCTFRQRDVAAAIKAAFAAGAKSARVQVGNMVVTADKEQRREREQTDGAGDNESKEIML